MSTTKTSFKPERKRKEENETTGGLSWLRVKTLSMDQFHMLKHLGTGMCGEVRMVKHKATGSVYAMKAFHHTGALQDQVVISKLNNERQVLSEVNSVWVEKMLHSVQDSHYHFIILEYIPGGSLAQLLQDEGNLTESQTRFYGAEMLMAINVVHRHGFMHRNIQLHNFLIDQFGHIKLAGFGASLRFLPAPTCRRMTAEASIKDGKPFLSSQRRDRIQIYQRKAMDNDVGPFQFMAPEVVRKRRTGIISYLKPVHPATIYSFAADFWSFGVCVYQMLFGQLPFVGKSKKELRKQIVGWRQNLAIPSVQPVSDEAKDLIKRLLVDEPYRLGFYGCEDVMSHVFFDNVDWLHLRDWPVPVPYETESAASSSTSLGPPAYIADLLWGRNKASSNNTNNRSTSLKEPAQQDKLHSGTSTCVDENAAAAAANELPRTTAASGSTAITSTVATSNASGVASGRSSEDGMNVSWSENSWNKENNQEIQMWLRNSQFAAPPSRDSISVAEGRLSQNNAVSTKKSESLLRLSEEIEQAEMLRGFSKPSVKKNASKNKRSICAIM